MNKKYYILIAILIAYFLIIFLVFGLDNLKLEQRTAKIFIDKETAWSLEKNKWNKIEIDNEKISNQKFNVFIKSSTDVSAISFTGCLTVEIRKSLSCDILIPSQPIT